MDVFQEGLKKTQFPSKPATNLQICLEGSWELVKSVRVSSTGFVNGAWFGSHEAQRMNESMSKALQAGFESPGAGEGKGKEQAKPDNGKNAAGRKEGSEGPQESGKTTAGGAEGQHQLQMIAVERSHSPAAA